MYYRKIVLLLAVLLTSLFLFINRTELSFDSVTVGVSVTNLDEATTWYKKIIGDKSVMQPIPTINEIEVVKEFWLQLIEVSNVKPGDSILRFGVTDLEIERIRLATIGIDIGEITRVEGVIAFCDFSDPYGNKLSIYQVLLEN